MYSQLVLSTHFYLHLFFVLHFSTVHTIIRIYSWSFSDGTGYLSPTTSLPPPTIYHYTPYNLTASPHSRVIYLFSHLASSRIGLICAT
ncbi:hypothetical protein EDB85DRAFT_1954495 [Lactarius pseudohatsudake]|nr:hypothetical protein EDB85DRAFT_1954495 [Lactarius pseudohatsudake]